MMLDTVAAKEGIRCKSHKSLVEILRSFAVLEVDFWRIKEMRFGGFEAKMQAYGRPNEAHRCWVLDDGASGDNRKVIGYLAEHLLKIAHFLLSSTATCFGYWRTIIGEAAKGTVSGLL